MKDCDNNPCQMAEEIRAIHRAVCGDPLHGHRGLVTRMDEVERDLKCLKRVKLWATGWIAGMSFCMWLGWEWMKNQLR